MSRTSSMCAAAGSEFVRYPDRTTLSQQANTSLVNVTASALSVAAEWRGKHETKAARTDARSQRRRQNP
jgi:hypothetical protein